MCSNCYHILYAEVIINILINFSEYKPINIEHSQLLNISHAAWDLHIPNNR